MYLGLAFFANNGRPVCKLDARKFRNIRRIYQKYKDRLDHANLIDRILETNEDLDVGQVQAILGFLENNY